MPGYPSFAALQVLPGMGTPIDGQILRTTNWTGVDLPFYTVILRLNPLLPNPRDGLVNLHTLLGELTHILDLVD